MTLITTSSGPFSVITSAQSFTSVWTDLGAEIDTSSVQRIGVWLELDINETENMCIRLYAKHTKNHTSGFYLPIRTVTSSDVNIQDEVLIFTDNKDQKALLSWELDGLIPAVQLQIMAISPGNAPGLVNSCSLTMGY